MDLTLSYQVYNGALVLPTLFSSSTNLLLASFDSLVSDVTITTDFGVMFVGEEFSLDGRTVEFLGSGTAQPGVDLGLGIVPLGSAVDLTIFQDTSTGEILFAYPNGEPNLLGALALIIDVDPVAYSAEHLGAEPICLGTGAQIATPTGPRAIETIRAGDHVLNMHGKPRKVLWVGERTLARPAPEHRPIIFSAEAQGRVTGQSDRTLKMSPQHRVAIGMRDGKPLLARAKVLVGLPGIRLRENQNPIRYHHILLAEHDVLLAEGLAVESLLLGSQAEKMLSASARTEIAGAVGRGPGQPTPDKMNRACGHMLSNRDAVAAIADGARPIWVPDFASFGHVA